MTPMAMLSTDRSTAWIPDVVYTFADSWNQGHELAARCGAAIDQVDVHAFPDGETLVTAVPNPRTRGGVVALYRSLDTPNQKLFELLQAASALRTSGAAKLILIAPYLPYMRQDRAFQPGQAISQTLIGELLATHFDGIVTVQPHLHRTHSLAAVFGETPALTLRAGHAIAADLRLSAQPSTIVVGPDEESTDLVRDVVADLGLTWFVAAKRRLGDNEVRIELPPDLEIEGHPIVIVDDIISSGGTVATLAKALKAAKCAPITVYAVHALFNQRAAVVMQRAGVSRIKSLSCVPHTSNAISVVDLISTGIGVGT